MMDVAFSPASSSYYNDIATRTVLKNSAKHKANGPAVAKLGNKPKTWKEIEAAHGPVITYPTTDKLMSLEDFKRLPDDLKVEFCDKMCDKYDIGLQHISRILFNKGDDGLRQFMRTIVCKDGRNLYTKTNYKKERMKTGLDQFKEDVKEWRKEQEFLKSLNDAIKQAKKKNLPSLMTLKQFKKMPVDDQINYINSLIDVYQVPSGLISVVLFKKANNWISNYFYLMHRNKEIHRLSMKDIRDKKLKDQKEIEFRKYVSAWEEFSNLDEEEEIKMEDPIDIYNIRVAEPVMEEVKEKLVECVEEVNEPMTNIVEEPKEYLPKVINLEVIEKAKEETKEETKPADIPEAPVEADPREYHEMHFTLNYIGRGINMNEIASFANIVGNKMVKVVLEVVEV